jgi:hypothetical protein
MEEQLNKYFPEYEELLKTKDYSMLSDSERSIVSRFSTEEEYTGMRKIILADKEISKEERKAIKPDPEILNNLLNTMKSNEAPHGVSKVVKNIFGYRIPAYQFAMYAAASIILFIFVLKREKIVTVQKPIYVCKTDTVEKYIVKETKPEVQSPAKLNYTKTDEPVTLNKKEVPDNTQITNDNNSSINILEFLGINVDLKEKIEDFKPKGRTMLDDSAIVKFLVKI